MRSSTRFLLRSQQAHAAQPPAALGIAQGSMDSGSGPLRARALHFQGFGRSRGPSRNFCDSLADGICPTELGQPFARAYVWPQDQDAYGSPGPPCAPRQQHEGSFASSPLSYCKSYTPLCNQVNSLLTLCTAVCIIDDGRMKGLVAARGSWHPGDHRTSGNPYPNSGDSRIPRRAR